MQLNPKCSKFPSSTIKLIRKTAFAEKDNLFGNKVLYKKYKKQLRDLYLNLTSERCAITFWICEELILMRMVWVYVYNIGRKKRFTIWDIFSKYIRKLYVYMSYVNDRNRFHHYEYNEFAINALAEWMMRISSCVFWVDLPMKQWCA